MSAHSILIVDDDITLKEILLDQFSFYDEYDVYTLGSATEAINILKEEKLDLILMDVGLPDMDGRDAVRIIRKNGIATPILMLTGHGTEADEVLGLESGANDYVTKPFKFNIFLARIRALLRVSEQNENAVYKFGPYKFIPSEKLIETDSGNQVKLTEKEVKIIRYLYRAGGPVSRENLLKEVWGYHHDVTTHTLETHVYRLRQKLKDTDESYRLLETIDGGYQLKLK